MRNFEWRHNQIVVSQNFFPRQRSEFVCRVSWCYSYQAPQFICHFMCIVCLAYNSPGKSCLIFSAKQTIKQKKKKKKKEKEKEIQSTLFISKPKGLSEILGDIRSSTYQICSIEEKLTWSTVFHKWACYLTPAVRDIFKKLLWKRGEIASLEHLFRFSTRFCYLLLELVLC